MLQTEDIELSDPVTVQMRLPVGVLEMLRRESKRDMIPFTLTLRKYLLMGCGDSVVSDERINPTDNVQTIQSNRANKQAEASS